MSCRKRQTRGEEREEEQREEREEREQKSEAQETLPPEPQNGIGRIISSGIYMMFQIVPFQTFVLGGLNDFPLVETSVTGFETKFKEQLENGDALIILHPTTCVFFSLSFFLGF